VNLLSNTFVVDSGSKQLATRSKSFLVVEDLAEVDFRGLSPINNTKSWHRVTVHDALRFAILAFQNCG